MVKKARKPKAAKKVKAFSGAAILAEREGCVAAVSAYMNTGGQMVTLEGLVAAIRARPAPGA